MRRNRFGQFVARVQSTRRRVRHAIQKRRESVRTKRGWTRFVERHNRKARRREMLNRTGRLRIPRRFY